MHIQLSRTRQGMEPHSRQEQLNRGFPQAHEGQSSKWKEPTSDPKVKIGIKAQDGDECYYRIPRDKRILSLLMRYCEEKRIEYATASFVYNGRRITSSRTPAQLGMEDGDMINAFLIQEGGGY